MPRMKTRPKTRWVTLGNHRRVQIDQRGRLVKGISREARGVHVRDLSTFMGDLRELSNTDCQIAGDYSLRTDRGSRETLRDRRGNVVSPRYLRKDVAIESLCRDNPQLFDFVQQNWGGESQAFLHWLRGRQRGPKPQLSPGDGRFDPINERWNLRGYRRCSSFLEALYITVPSSRRWEDITPDRLWPLEECVGFRLNPPEEAMRLPATRQSVEACQSEKSARHDDLVETARRSRLPPKNVPF
jgi:hypothetical protein